MHDYRSGGKYRLTNERARARSAQFITEPFVRAAKVGLPHLAHIRAARAGHPIWADNNSRNDQTHARASGQLARAWRCALTRCELCVRVLSKVR